MLHRLRPSVVEVLVAIGSAAAGLAVFAAVDALVPVSGDVAAAAIAALVAGACGGVAAGVERRRRTGHEERHGVEVGLAEVAGLQHSARQNHQARAAARARVEACLGDAAITVLFQPIVDSRDGTVVGAEALARFVDGRPPDVWFSEAADVGLGAELELLAIELILDQAEGLPDDVYVGINAAPATVLHERLPGLLGGSRVAVMLELTAYDPLVDYGAVVEALRPLRTSGVRLAADDAGAGYGGLTHLLQLAPDCIKLDRSLVDRVDADPPKRALVSAVADFATQIGAGVVAEGVETAEELRVLTLLGVHLVQGFHLARPAPLPEVLPTFVNHRATRVLVVHDDRTVGPVLRGSLARAGFDVGRDVASSEAAEAARARPVDVVLVGTGVAGAPGLQTLRALRALEPAPRVVLLTAGEPDDEVLDQVDGSIDATIPTGDVAERLRGILDDAPPAPRTRIAMPR